MFHQKRKSLIVHCDTYIDLYDTCNLGCEMCKFHKNVKEVHKTFPNFDQYHHQKVLFCYQTEPYIKDDFIYVQNAIENLHRRKCRIVFLTRKACSLEKQLDLFFSTDIIGVSISENSTKNSQITDIIRLFKQAKKKHLSTWISLEPVLTATYANHIIKQISPYVDLIRIGKDDNFNYEWEKVYSEIQKNKKVYIKME